MIVIVIVIVICVYISNATNQIQQTTNDKKGCGGPRSWDLAPGTQNNHYLSCCCCYYYYYY